jgi:DNA-binding transcriptional ArsR family regulator
MKTTACGPRTLLQARPAHVEAFTALSHQTRLELFFLLVRRREEVSAGELQEALEIPGPTLSHHLAILRRAGLVESRKEERHVYYTVRRDMVSDLVRLLTACC